MLLPHGSRESFLSHEVLGVLVTLRVSAVHAGLQQSRHLVVLYAHTVSARVLEHNVELAAFPQGKDRTS